MSFTTEGGEVTFFRFQTVPGKFLVSHRMGSHILQLLTHPPMFPEEAPINQEGQETITESPAELSLQQGCH